MDGYADVEGGTAQFARDLGVRSTVGAPILVDGKLWGALLAATRGREPLPETAEARIAAFTELVSTTISNAEARHELQRIGAEQEALRKAATLVAAGVSPTEVFAAITASAADVFGGAPFASLIRVGPDETATMVAGCAACSAYVGRSWTVPGDDPGITRTVVDSCRPSRIEDHSRVHGPVGEAARALGVGSVVGAPVIVDGSVWGVLAVGAAQTGPPLAPDAADRLADFAELVSTAIVNTEARDQVRRLLDEQAALRRVATLVARGVSPADLFAAVTEEVGGLFGSEAAVARFEPDGSAMVVVGLTKGIPVVSIGARWPLEDFLASTAVYRTGRPARNDHTGHRNTSGSVAEDLRTMDFVSTVAAPIVVEGNLWGVMTVSDRREPLPPDTDERVAKFTELVATAIANAESRAELAASEARAHELAMEQASLRRVAELVAKAAKADEVFSAVAQEVALVFDVQKVTVCRYEADTILVLSSSGAPEFPAGSRWPVDLPSLPASIHHTGDTARIDDFADADGLDAAARDAGVKAAVGVPIVVGGAVWGSINVASTKNERFPPDAEERLARFTELVATSVANATMREELAASRARIVAAGDDARRRIERDLHDGAQQRLVTLAVALRRAEARIPAGLDALRAEVTRVAEGATAAVEELRELSRGIHPSILTEGGLSPALKALGRRSAVRVKLDVGFEHRLPDHVEVAAYYTVSEALTNASKHANAMRVWVALRVEDDMLLLSIRDDGVGGADPHRGSGLIGLIDRIEALGGRIQIESPPGSGTTIEVRIPILQSFHRQGESDERPSPALTPVPPA